MAGWPGSSPDGGLAVVMVHTNAADECARTLAALDRQDTRMQPRIIIVDNGSRAAQLEQLKLHLPSQAAIIELGRNVGWGPAFNVAIQRLLEDGDCKYCAVMSEDHILEPSNLRLLVNAAEGRPSAGIVCAEWEASLPRFSALRGPSQVHVDPAPPGTVTAVHWPHGMMLLRMRAVREFGLFDERYWLYGDDIEIGLRARRHGWEVVMAWGALLENPMTRLPSVARAYLFTRNTLLMIRDYRGQHFAAARGALLAGKLGVQMMYSPAEQRELQRARLRGILDYFGGRFGPPPHDMTVQR